MGSCRFLAAGHEVSGDILVLQAELAIADVHRQWDWYAYGLRRRLSRPRQSRIEYEQRFIVVGGGRRRFRWRLHEVYRRGGWLGRQSPLSASLLRHFLQLRRMTGQIVARNSRVVGHVLTNHVVEVVREPGEKTPAVDDVFCSRHRIGASLFLKLRRTLSAYRGVQSRGHGVRYPPRK